MRKAAMTALLLWFGFTIASAQVKVEVTTEQDQFLPGETIMVGVRITNHSGQKLHLGRDNTWLFFTVEDRDGRVVSVLDPISVEGPFEVGSAERATKYVDLAPGFDFSRSGRYLITATVRVAELNREIRSSPKGLDVIEGARLWEREVGLPSKEAGDAAPKTRKYILQQANYLRARIRLYLRITDGDGLKTIRLVPVGNLVSFSKPDPQVSGDNNLHILFQSGPRNMSYHVFNPEGELLTRQTYEINQSRPHLKMDSEGVITVQGGLRLELPSDIPRRKEEAPPKPDPKSAPLPEPAAAAAPEQPEK